MKKIFQVWDEVYFTPKAHYWNIVRNNTLYQLRPKKGTIYGIDSGDSIFGDTIYGYKIKCDKSYFEKYSNIHTCFETEEEYYDELAEQIIWYWESRGLEKIKHAVKKFFKPFE